MCSNLPLYQERGGRGAGERAEEGGVVVSIYREKTSLRNFLVPPSGTVSSFRNTDYWADQDG